MNWIRFAIIVIIAIAAVCGLSLITYIVAKAMNKGKLADIAMCVLLWTVAPIALPVKARKCGLISKMSHGWLLAFLSPFTLIVCIVIALVVVFYIGISQPFTYDDLLFKSRQEIAAITEIQNFPEFEYIRHSHNNWDGSTFAENRFTDEAKAEAFYAKIGEKAFGKDNVYWSKQSISDKENQEFFGSSEVYVCRRGWNTPYTKGPKGIGKNSKQVVIAIGKKAFTVRDCDCLPWNMDFYSSPDSLSKITGISFPKYKIVNVNFSGAERDPWFKATLELNSKPDKSLIRSILNADKWEAQDDGKYHFFLEDRKGDLWEEIILDPTSRYIELSVNQH